MTSLTFSYSPDVEQLGMVVERLPIGVIVFSKQKQEIVFANLAARRLLHPSVLRAGQPLPEPWPSVSLRRYAEGLARPGLSPDKIIELDGHRVYKLSGLTARSSNTGVLLIEDISARERRSRAEREFVANAAHELLSPLTGIVGAAHVLEAGAKEVREDRDRFIGHIARECDRLTRIARSLLVLARAQSGEEPPRLEIIRLREVLEEVARHTDGNVTIRCDDALTVLADFDLLVQAAVNLVRNALTHGSSGEAIVEARVTSGHLVEIDVADGSSDQHEVGELRGRFRTGSGRDGGGFGLGLSIAAQSLEVMDGRLFFDGTTARVELPRGEVADE